MVCIVSVPLLAPAGMTSFPVTLRCPSIVCSPGAARSPPPARRQAAHLICHRHVAAAGAARQLDRENCRRAFGGVCRHLHARHQCFVVIRSSRSPCACPAPRCPAGPDPSSVTVTVSSASSNVSSSVCTVIMPSRVARFDDQRGIRFGSPVVRARGRAAVARHVADRYVLRDLSRQLHRKDLPQRPRRRRRRPRSRRRLYHVRDGHGHGAVLDDGGGRLGRRAQPHHARGRWKCG